MIKAIIFDCFGVIISDALEAIVAEFRYEQPEIARRIVEAVTAASKGLITREESTKRVAALLRITPEQYVDKIKNGEVKNQQLLDCIAVLRKDYKTALLSNISPGGLLVRFSPDELAQYFDTIVASGDIGYAKPEPQAYEITAARLGVRLDECVFIDDRQEYCDGAMGVGMQALQYQSFEQVSNYLNHLI